MICFVDYRITNEEKKALENLNIEPIIVPKSSLVYDAINGHVDIQLNILNGQEKLIIVHKDMNNTFLENLSKHNVKYILSANSLGMNYPNNIILNALILDDLFVHNTRFSDSNLIRSQISKRIITVKQGYTKCSILPLNNDALITSDKGLYKTLINENKDILLLPPSNDILLPSLNYGFIGGVGGMISENKLALFGELKHYEFGESLYKFLYKYDIEPISLRKGKLIDRGSLFVL